MIPTEYFQIYIYLMFFLGTIAYATLDGFDLGVGSLHLFTKGDQERRLMLNAIGPVWDSNTTWIVITSGILFAGFPKVFANLSSSLYMPTMLLIFGYMLRGAAIEFRSKEKSTKWRSFWDGAFFFASLLLALMMGMILATLIQGLPLDEKGEYLGSTFALFTPYSALVSLFGLSTFMMHGSLYMLMKTEGKFHDKMRRWSKKLILAFFLLWIPTTTATLFTIPHMIGHFLDHPSLWVFPAISLACIRGIFRSVKKQKDGRAFAFSCLSILFLLVLVVVSLYPNLVLSSIDPTTRSLTLFNSSASRTALIVITLVTFTGVPLGFFYGAYIHRIFKGKVKIDPMSY